MKSCDGAFKKGLLSREGFEELFSKIDSFADFFVAHNGNVLGYAAMYNNDLNSKTAYITLIAVAEDYQNRGIGKLLIKFCEKKAVEKGMKYIRLEVAKNNKVARNFYEKNGFIYENAINEKSMFMRKEL